MSAGFLIWEKGLCGPMPVKRQELPTYFDDKDRKTRVIRTIALGADEFALSLDELAERYPERAEPEGERFTIARAEEKL